MKTISCITDLKKIGYLAYCIITLLANAEPSETGEGSPGWGKMNNVRVLRQPLFCVRPSATPVVCLLLVNRPTLWTELSHICNIEQCKSFIRFVKGLAHHHCPFDNIQHNNLAINMGLKMERSVVHMFPKILPHSQLRLPLNWLLDYWLSEYRRWCSERVNIFRSQFLAAHDDDGCTGRRAGGLLMPIH